jgi:hypothetical protein
MLIYEIKMTFLNMAHRGGHKITNSVMLFISVHMINTAKQTQLTHSSYSCLRVQLVGLTRVQLI